MCALDFFRATREKVRQCAPRRKRGGGKRFLNRGGNGLPAPVERGGGLCRSRPKQRKGRAGNGEQIGRAHSRRRVASAAGVPAGRGFRQRETGGRGVAAFPRERLAASRSRAGVPAGAKNPARVAAGGKLSGRGRAGRVPAASYRAAACVPSAASAGVPALSRENAIAFPSPAGGIMPK